MMSVSTKKLKNYWALIVTSIFLLSPVFFVSCGESRTLTAERTGEPINMRYAENLKISENPGYTEVTIRNPWDTLKTLQRYILIDKDSVVPKNLPQGTIIRTPVNNALVYSTVHAALISELEAGEAVGGICDSDYVTDSLLKKRLADGSITDCGLSQNPDIEKIIKLRPEIIMLSPYSDSDDNAKIAKLGIPIVQCADYMEVSALGRAEWLRFYGLLFGKRDNSEKMFRDSENEYLKLKESAKTANNKPKVILDQVYGQVWYVPGKRSLMNGIIKDAGGVNPFEGYGKGSVPLAPERVLSEAHDANIWLIRYNQENEKSLSELAKDAPVNSRFKAYTTGNVYGCNTRYSDFFEETPFHPDRLLKEMIRVIHPELSGVGDTPAYYKKMK